MTTNTLPWTNFIIFVRILYTYILIYTLFSPPSVLRVEVKYGRTGGSRGWWARPGERAAPGSRSSQHQLWTAQHAFLQADPQCVCSSVLTGRNCAKPGLNLDFGLRDKTQLQQFLRCAHKILMKNVWFYSHSSSEAGQRRQWLLLPGFVATCLKAYNNK